MKRKYSNPQIDISLFKTDNILTASGVTGVTNAGGKIDDKANEIGVSLTNVVTLEWE